RGTRVPSAWDLGPTQARAGTTRVGRTAAPATARATLPSSSSPGPPRPRVPTTTRSAPTSSAMARSVGAGSPSAVRTCTVRPRSRTGATTGSSAAAARSGASSSPSAAAAVSGPRGKASTDSTTCATVRAAPSAPARSAARSSATSESSEPSTPTRTCRTFGGSDTAAGRPGRSGTTRVGTRAVRSRCRLVDPRARSGGPPTPREPTTTRPAPTSSTRAGTTSSGDPSRSSTRQVVPSPDSPRHQPSTRLRSSARQRSGEAAGSCATSSRPTACTATSSAPVRRARAPAHRRASCDAADPSTATARRRASPTRDGHLLHGLLRLLPGHRDPHLEDAVLVAGRDVVHVRPLRERNATRERAVAELRPVGLLGLGLAALLPAGVDVEHVVHDAQVDVLVGVDVRQLGPDDQGAVVVEELLDPQPARAGLVVPQPAE